MNDTDMQVPSDLGDYISNMLHDKVNIEGFDSETPATLFLLTRKDGELVKTIIEPHPLVSVAVETLPELLAMMFAFYVQTHIMHGDVVEAIEAADEFVGILLFCEASGLVLDAETHEEAAEKAREMAGSVAEHENSVPIKTAILALDFDNIHVYAIHEGDGKLEHTNELVGVMRAALAATFALYKELCRK